MLKLTIVVLLEAFLGVVISAVILAIVVPLTIQFGIVTPGDLEGTVLITVVLICSVGGMLFRPGSALNRLGRS